MIFFIIKIYRERQRETEREVRKISRRGKFNSENKLTFMENLTSLILEPFPRGRKYYPFIMTQI